MAEIRSTLDMVMERAKRMAERAADVPVEQQFIEKGMRLIVEFLDGKHTDLNALLQKEDPATQMAVRKGMAKALLRNIVLPRDEVLMQNSTAALAGIQELGNQDDQLMAVCSELTQILGQYTGHKEQIQQQLEENIRTGIAQQLQHQTGEIPDMSTIDPTMHPQFKPELERAISELNDQYSKALNQRKEFLLQRFS